MGYPGLGRFDFGSISLEWREGMGSVSGVSGLCVGGTRMRGEPVPRRSAMPLARPDLADPLEASASIPFIRVDEATGFPCYPEEGARRLNSRTTDAEQRCPLTSVVGMAHAQSSPSFLDPSNC